MRKVILTVALVALLVAAVFGGQALASSKPADVTVSEETSSILGSSYWGYPVRMKTLSGTAEISGEADVVILDETYSGARHVSITVFIWGSDATNPPFADGVQIITDIPDIGPAIMESHELTDFYKTWEFNTDNWQLVASDYGGTPLLVNYWVTVTYPSNQW